MYDGDWSLTSLAASNAPWFVGNGKVGLQVSHPDVLGITRDPALATLAMPLEFDASGFYSTNAAPVVAPFLWRVSDPPASPVYTDTTVHLDTGITTVTWTVADSVVMEADIFAPRHLPFCLMCTLRVSGEGPLPSTLFHEGVAANEQCSFDAGRLFVRQTSIDIVSMSGGATSGNTQLAASFAYIPSEYVNLEGFNVLAGDRRRFFQRLACDTNPPGGTLRVHVLAAMASARDFANPDVEVKRILLHALKSTPERIRSDHVSAWTSLWNGVSLRWLPTDDESRARQLNGMTRTLLHQVFSSVRQVGAFDAAAANTCLLDPTGNLFWDSDLWLLPLLLLVRPPLARGLLETRCKDLEAAMRTAQAHGFSGALFPYRSQAVVDPYATLWDLAAPIRVFNGAVVAINCWNYFRATKDVQWLTETGFPVLRQVCDFYVSFASPQATMDGVASLASSEPTDRNLLTTVLARLALKFGIEASHMVGRAVPCAWSELYFGLKIPLEPVEPPSSLLWPWQGFQNSGGSSHHPGAASGPHALVQGAPLRLPGDVRDGEGQSRGIRERCR
jgi:protein-glucosylgalactosylhydroxylysine glucosidase